jgi:hypothetical protein
MIEAEDQPTTAWIDRKRTQPDRGVGLNVYLWGGSLKFLYSTKYSTCTVLGTVPGCTGTVRVGLLVRIRRINPVFGVPLSSFIISIQLGGL